MGALGNPKHGLRWHPSYGTWNGMMQRCHNRKSKSWKNYGGRGIKVCKRWHSVSNFIEDMGSKPPGHTLDRKNNDRGYYPSNCRWVSGTSQCNNMRKNVRISYRGKTLTLAEWSRLLGISRNTVKGRWRRGFSSRRILFG